MNDSNQSPYERLISNLEGHGSRVKKIRAKEVMAQCPSHEDHNPSLHVTDGGDKVLLRCMAGCPTRSVLDALGLEDEDLFAEKGKTREIVDTYDYDDEDGKFLFQAIRFYPKGFAQRRPLPGGQWAWNLTGVRRVLYHLREVLAAPDIVYLPEGEKDVNRLRTEGVVATTAPMGAGKWRDEYAQSLIGKRVVIIADRDESGYAHAERIKESLDAAGITNKIVQAKTGKDVSDHLDAGHSLEELEPATGIAPVISTRRLPGRNENEAEIVVGPLHVICTKPYRTGRGYASKIKPTVTVLGSGKRVHWGIEVQLVSASGRSGLITALNRIEGIDKSEVTGWVEDLFTELVTWSEERPPLIQMAVYPDPPPESKTFLIQPWWPATGATVIGGAPGNYKTWLGAGIGISVTRGETIIHTHKPGWAKVNKQARVLYLDWEASPERIKPRINALLPGASLAYLHYSQPLPDVAPDLTEYIRDEGFEAVIIDSLSASIGGSLIDEAIANRYWDSVAALEVPALILAHKSADAIRNRRARLFGSIMHEARPRLIWNLETAPDSNYLVAECFKDSDYNLRGVKTAWEMEFTSPGEFESANRCYFNPTAPESVRLDDDEDERPRRGLTDAQRRKVVLRDALMRTGQLMIAGGVEVLWEAGIQADESKVGRDLRALAQEYPEISVEELPSSGGRPALVYTWKSTL